MALQHRQTGCISQVKHLGEVSRLGVPDEKSLNIWCSDISSQVREKLVEGGEDQLGWWKWNVVHLLVHQLYDHLLAWRSLSFVSSAVVVEVIGFFSASWFSSLLSQAMQQQVMRQKIPKKPPTMPTMKPQPGPGRHAFPHATVAASTSSEATKLRRNIVIMVLWSAGGVRQRSQF